MATCKNFLKLKHMTNRVNNQYFLKTVLLLQTIALLIYTFITIQNDGINVPGKAMEYVNTMAWIGQFSLDFSCYLLLSGLWVMWRNRFTKSSIVLGLLTMIFGIILFAPYLLYLLRQEKGNIEAVLVGFKE